MTLVSVHSRPSLIVILSGVLAGEDLSVAEKARRIAAHHEAGHARAAVKIGGTVDGIDISYTVGLTRGWTAVDVPEITDLVVYAYAGAWAQTRLVAPEARNDFKTLWNLVRTNSDDWAEIQHGLGRHVSDHDLLGAQIYGVERRTGAPPGELRPQDATVMQIHAELEDEWDNIAELAALMLEGATTITVGAGPALIKVNEARWLRPHYTPPAHLNAF